MERRRREENGGDGGVLRAILEVIVLVETLRSSPFELVHCTTITWAETIEWRKRKVSWLGSEFQHAKRSTRDLNLALTAYKRLSKYTLDDR